MIDDRTEHYRVRISDEGLRRAANDNALRVAASKRHEIFAGLACWLIAIAFGIYLGWMAADGIMQ